MAGGDDRRPEAFFCQGLVIFDRVDRCDAACIFGDMTAVNGVVEEAGGRGVGRQYGRMAEIITWEVVEMDCAVRLEDAELFHQVDDVQAVPQQMMRPDSTRDQVK